VDSRFPAVAEQLLLIERELRVQGWWADVPPSEAALSSPEPFCIDTLEFEQWLQWIFLPRMKLLLENDAALPTVSGIREMAEEVYRDRVYQARGLLEALGEFDRLIVGRG